MRVSKCVCVCQSACACACVKVRVRVRVRAQERDVMLHMGEQVAVFASTPHNYVAMKWVGPKSEAAASADVQLD